MTEFADIEGGRIAYDVTGQGPLVVLAHGIGDRRQAYRFLAPRLAQAATGSPPRTCAGTMSPAWAGSRSRARTPSPAPTSPATCSR